MINAQACRPGVSTRRGLGAADPPGLLSISASRQGGGDLHQCPGTGEGKQEGQRKICEKTGMATKEIVLRAQAR